MQTDPEPWWLEEGQEQCLACEQLFHFEALLFCQGCDAAVCSSCTTAVIETRETFCSACADNSKREIT